MILNSSLPNLGSTIRVHIDTEFTDFINRDLISIGAAADNGDTFYGENSEFLRPWASTWVQENIYPLLDLEKFGMRRLELSARLWSWIEELPCDFVIITVDYAGDFELLHDLFQEDKHPKMLEWQNLKVTIYKTCDEHIKALGGSGDDYDNLVRKVCANFDLSFMDYFIRTKETQHHALSDAKANREAWTALVNNFGMPR